MIYFLVLLLAWAGPAMAFGAGNIASISKVEGKNWRHGDIEDVLLSLAMAQAFQSGKKFTNLAVKQVYWGNWARDYSQAIDVGTVKMVSAEAIRLLLSILGFLTFGYGSKEFELTAERLGCYRPEEHIDNPKGYADGVDARNYHPGLRGPIDEEAELSIDPSTGMKNYIANERAGIMTSARYIREKLGRCIELGRRYKNSGSDKDLHEAFRVLGAGLHCLEDFFAHSNYIELALAEIGETNIFPHCGRDTQIRLEGANGPVYPLVTGTFGGVDFLHSVTGEVSDKLTQNEIDELEGTLIESKNADTSMLRDLLDKIPDGFFGGTHESDKVSELQNNANNAQMQNMSISPREPEEFTAYVRDVYNQVMPAIGFHDEVMKSITAATERIPVLPKIIEQLEEELSRFVFSVIAPYVVPLIRNIKNELSTGSEEIIHSSENEQHVVFNDDRSTDPTHSMLSKDHFSNILNEVAGQCAAKTLHWAVPQIMAAIDDDNVDVDRLLDIIVNGVMYHPAQRDVGDRDAHEGRRRIYQSVKEWWRDMGDDQREDYRRKLSREGVRRGENHKEGVYDTGHGHGCAGKLKMNKLYGRPNTVEDKIANAAAGVIIEGVGNALTGGTGSGNKQAGGLEGLLGAANSLLGGAFGGDEKKPSRSPRREDDRPSSRQGYGGRTDDSREQRSDYRGGAADDYVRSSYGRQEEGRYDSGGRTHGGDTYGQQQESSYRSSEYGNVSNYGRQESSHGSGGYGSNDTYSQQQQDSYGQREESTYASGGYGDSTSHGYREESSYSGSGNYGSRQGGSYGGSASYGRPEESGYGSREEISSGRGGSYGDRHESSYGGGDSYGRREESGYGSGTYGGSGYDRGEGERGFGHREEERSYGRREEEPSYGRREEHGYGSREESYGGGHKSHKHHDSDDSDKEKKSYRRNEEERGFSRREASYGDDDRGHRRKDSDESDDGKKHHKRRDSPDSKPKKYKSKKSHGSDDDDDDDEFDQHHGGGDRYSGGGPVW